MLYALSVSNEKMKRKKKTLQQCLNFCQGRGGVEEFVIIII